MLNNIEQLNIKAENILVKIKEEEDIFKRIELCTSIINLYSEYQDTTSQTIETNDILSDAWYYRAIFIGRSKNIFYGNEHEKELGISLADGKEHEWDNNVYLAGDDPIGALGLRLIMLSYMEKALKLSDKDEQKNKCYILLIKYYLFIAEYFLFKINDIYKFIELSNNIVKYVYIIKNNDKLNLIIDDINKFINKYDSEHTKRIIHEKYGNIEETNAENTISKLKRILKNESKKPINIDINDDFSDIDFDKTIPKIDFFYRELLIKIIESINEEKILNTNTEEAKNLNTEKEYYNKGLNFLKRAIHFVITDENNNEYLNEEQIKCYADSEEAKGYFNIVLDNIYDGKFLFRAYLLRSMSYFYSGKYIMARADIEMYKKFKINNFFDLHYYGNQKYINLIECIQDILKYTNVINTTNIKNEELANAYNKRGLARAFFGPEHENSWSMYLDFFDKEKHHTLSHELQGDQLNKIEYDFMQAIKLNPKNFEAFQNLGLFCNMLARAVMLTNAPSIVITKSFLRAIEWFEESTRIKPTTETYYYLANCYDKIGNHKQAVKNYKKAIDLGNKRGDIFPDIYVNLTNTYGANKQPKLAIKTGEKILNIIKDKKMAGTYEPPLYNNLACDYDRIEKYDKAIEYFKKAISLSPKYIDAIGGLASVYEKIGNFTAAIEYYTQAYRQSKYFEDLYKNWENRKKEKDEEYIVNYYLQRMPQKSYLTASYLLGRASSYHSIGKINLAITDLEECLSFKKYAYGSVFEREKMKIILTKAEQLLNCCLDGTKYKIYSRRVQDEITYF